MPIVLDGTAGIDNNATDLSYTGTLTGGTGVVNLGSGQLVKDANGNVGIGTATPERPFELQTTGTSVPMRVAGDSTESTIDFTDAGTTANFRVRVGCAGDNLIAYAGGAERMRIDSSGGLILAGSTAQKATGTTWSNPSDERLKDNIRDYGKGIAELMQVRVREWEYNGKGGTVEGTKGLGVVADEVMVVLPDTVESYEAKLNADDEEATAIKKFDATEITWLLVKAVQELKAINDAQAQTIESLTARVVALEQA